MIEIHPFGIFVPAKPEYLLLGSFPAKQKPTDDPEEWWFYGSKVNQFWRIFESVYNLELKTKVQKKALLNKLSIAMSDIIYKSERRDGNSLDNNLVNIEFNIKMITEFLAQNDIKKIFFTSRFVEKNFKKILKSQIAKFPHIELVALPSPSPRYAAMSKAEKIQKYSELLPKLKKLNSLGIVFSR